MGACRVATEQSLLVLTPLKKFLRKPTVVKNREFLNNLTGNLIQGEGSDSLKTALEAKGTKAQ